MEVCPSFAQCWQGLMTPGRARKTEGIPISFLPVQLWLPVIVRATCSFPEPQFPSVE